MYLDTDRHKWHDQSIDPELFLDPTRFPRQSHCAIEVDICVSDIINRLEIETRDLHANFEERLRPPSPDEKLVHSLAGLWRDETRRRKLRMGLTDPSSTPFPPEVLISMSADPRSTEKGGWIHEEEFRELVKELVEDEQGKIGASKVTFDDFVKPSPLEHTIQTVLESVQDLFPENLQRYSAQIDSVMPHDYLDVQDREIVAEAENQVPDFEGADFPSYESDEEVARTIALTQRRPEAEDVLQEQNDKLIDGQQSISAPANINAAEAVPEQVSFGNDDSSGDVMTARPLGDAPESFRDVPQFAEDLQADNGRSAKRRKLSGTNPEPLAFDTGLSSEEHKTPVRGRKVGFADIVTPEQDRFSQRSLSPKKHDQDIPSGSQLSQTSIKANGITSSPYQSFQVVKNPHSRGPPSTEKKSTGALAPATPRTPGVTSAQKTPFTPWTKTPATVPTQTERSLAHKPPPALIRLCLLYTSPSPRDGLLYRMPSSA